MTRRDVRKNHQRKTKRNKFDNTELLNLHYEIALQHLLKTLHDLAERNLQLSNALETFIDETA